MPRTHLAGLLVDLQGELSGWGQDEGDGELLAAAVLSIILQDPRRAMCEHNGHTVAVG